MSVLTRTRPPARRVDERARQQAYFPEGSTRLQP
jgi:hypothetical protein